MGMNELDVCVTHGLPLSFANTLSRVDPVLTFVYISGAGTNMYSNQI